MSTQNNHVPSDLSKASTLHGLGTAASIYVYYYSLGPTAHDGEHALVCSKPDVGGPRSSRVLA